MKSPKISIIIPCYNQAIFLEETLQSVLDQTYTNWECLIINDGSTDATDKIAQNWIKKDNRFLYFHKENGGLSAARNFGLEKMTGDFVQFLDSDDCLERSKFQQSMGEILNNPTANIVISNFEMFVDNVQKTTEPYCTLTQDNFNFKNMLYNWDITYTIPIHCGFFNKALFDYFRFPENLSAKEDWVMWVNLYKKQQETIFIDKPLALYRKNPKGMTMTKNMLPDILKAIRFFKSILSDEDFQKLNENIISKYYNSSQRFKLNLIDLKSSNVYKIVYFIKKVLIKFKLLKPFNELLKWLARFKIFA
jgi:glycosyltransferase involved in cell wall biosynthesis